MTSFVSGDLCVIFAGNSNTMSVQRFGVSLKKELLEDLDALVRRRAFPNRSQALAFLIEKYKVEKGWEEDAVVTGAILLVYDHHKRDVVDQSIHIQHEYQPLILALQHIHVTHDACLETIAVKGRAHEIRELADKLIGMKGVEYGDLMMSKVVNG